MVEKILSDEFMNPVQRMNPELIISLLAKGYRPDLARTVPDEEAFSFFEGMFSENPNLEEALWVTGPFQGKFRYPEVIGIDFEGQDAIIKSHRGEVSISPVSSMKDKDFYFSSNLNLSKIGDSYWSLKTDKGNGHLSFYTGKKPLIMVPKAESLLDIGNDFEHEAEDYGRVWNAIGAYLDLRMTEIPKEKQNESENQYGRPVYEGKHATGLKFRFGTRKRVHLFYGEFPLELPQSHTSNLEKRLKEIREKFTTNSSDKYPISLDGSNSIGGHVEIYNGERFMFRVIQEMIRTQKRVLNTYR